MRNSSHARKQVHRVGKTSSKSPGKHDIIAYTFLVTPARQGHFRVPANTQDGWLRWLPRGYTTDSLDVSTTSQITIAAFSVSEHESRHQNRRRLFSLKHGRLLLESITIGRRIRNQISRAWPTNSILALYANETLSRQRVRNAISAGINLVFQSSSSDSLLIDFFKQCPVIQIPQITSIGSRIPREGSGTHWHAHIFPPAPHCKKGTMLRLYPDRSTRGRDAISNQNLVKTTYLHN